MLFVVVVTVHRASKLKGMDKGLVAHIRNTGNRQGLVGVLGLGQHSGTHPEHR